jgi:hypothetical protein
LLVWTRSSPASGPGETFAWQNEGAKPDLMVLGKALGVDHAVSAVVGRGDVLGVLPGRARHLRQQPAGLRDRPGVRLLATGGCSSGPRSSATCCTGGSTCSSGMA